MDAWPMQIIAHIRSDFPEKFGIPRQSGLVESLRARVVFTPPFRIPEALRGLEEFSHIWLIWQFSASAEHPWTPMVRPPRLGGNKRVGVFASRSPFRPNPIGLSSVRLLSVDLDTPEGPVLQVAGADLMDGTPIFDIKPYIPYGDCHSDATGGFTDRTPRPLLRVVCPPELLARLPEDRREALLGVLANDPRPPYQHDPQRRYGLAFAGFEVGFTVDGGVLRVETIERR